ncbi:predicted protein [Naegleria gruberi]|uniref:Predicted protein n=1 Tax=Naegleria gruberi TaxID=5762 RepID=D2V8Y1_NAEGR|nr:uncharacterized protein NAEGRDRAFT_65322 [Naegleria gruberi]EFC46769.1 predicted protein [Naegleria gruberi]|eukprot:XP_002679513.1 predicted protein [Naegleria gruberi strain NEG-M]
MSEDWADRTYVLEAVKQRGNALKYADEAFKKDREIVLEAVKKNGLIIQYADSSLKRDREIVLEAVKQRGYAIQYADSLLKKDREIVLECVKQDGLALEYVDLSLQKDREIVLAAVKQNGLALRYADSSLKKDREIALESVKQRGYAIQYADSLLKKDREIVLEAVKQDGLALQYAYFQNDREIVLEAVKQNGSAVEYADSSLKKDREFILESVKQHGLTLKYADSLLKKDREVVSEAVKQDILALKYVDSSFKRDREFILEAVKQHSLALEYADSSLQRDIVFTYSLFKLNKENARKFSPSITKTIEESINLQRKLSSNIIEQYSKIFMDEKDLYYAIELTSLFNPTPKVLGYGGEGVAFKVFHKSSKSLRALKLKYDPEESEESTKETINLLNRTDIEGKIKCFDCEIIQNHLYSVMELGEESLSNYISRNNESEIYRNGFIKKEKLIEILEIFIKVLNSVQSIHDHNILHRDLDPQNIVKVQDLYKIIDFETSRVIKTGNSITIARGKFAYMSPEVSHDNYSDDLLKSGDDEKLAHNVGQITISCDIFSLGCILLKLLTNCPLQLCSTFVNDSDVSKYNDKYPYFSGHGKYFYTVVTTTEGEMKLHYAIEKLINETINPDLGVNNILIRSIISMIQRDSSKRLDCYSHKLTIENILKFLKGEIKDITLNIEKQVGELKKISPLRSYSQLAEENNKITDEKTKLSDENSNLLERIKMLEEEIRKLTQTI